MLAFARPLMFDGNDAHQAETISPRQLRCTID